MCMQQVSTGLTSGGVNGQLGAVSELHGDLLTGLLQLDNVSCGLPLALPPIAYAPSHTTCHLTVTAT